MYYFGRIIGAFFNQLFRFLFWNKFGQKILIAIIIGLISFWCLGMTKVHAVEEIEDINYKVKSYYDGVVNEAIIRLYNNWDNINDAWKNNFLNNTSIIYWYYGQTDGSSLSNAQPLNSGNLYFILQQKGQNISNVGSITTYDYLGVTGYSMYTINKNVTYINTAGGISSAGNGLDVYFPAFVLTYTPSNWKDFVNGLKNNDTEEIKALLEDIKAEQQATNEFLNEEIDETGISVEAPQVTDTASENMSNNLHTQINTLTSQLQSTVNNYYEGWDAYVWTIPLPQYIGGNISFDSGVTRRIIGSNGVVFNVIQAIWVILFGGYIVGFIKRMLDWVQTGKIFDEGGLADFIWWMDTNNEIIKASMM